MKKIKRKVKKSLMKHPIHGKSVLEPLALPETTETKAEATGGIGELIVKAKNQHGRGEPS